MKQLLNLYPITGVAELETEYRLIDIVGLHDSPDDPDLIHENAGALVGQVASRLRCPAALIRKSAEYQLAVPANRKINTFEVQVRPDVVRLEPQDETHPLAFAALTPEQVPIAQQLLAAELRTPLRQDQQLWSSYGSFFFKRPTNIRDDKRDIDIFTGFGFRIVPFEDAFYVSLDLTTKFVETQWMIDAYDEAALHGLHMRHALYLYGQRWYPIQFLGLTGQTIQEQGFVPNDTGPTRYVYEWTLEACKDNPPHWIQRLDPTSPAIRYRYPGGSRPFVGALALCRLLLRTDDPERRRYQRRTALRPDERARQSAHIIERFFQRASFMGQPLTVEATPHAQRARRFKLPALEFGQGKVLAVGGDDGVAFKDYGRARLDHLLDGVAFKDYGRARLDHLLDPEGGIAITSPLDPQYVVMPKGLGRNVADDFVSRLSKAMQALLQTSYRPKRVMYDDNGARTLKQQVDAVLKGLDDAGVRGGHGVLVLPDDARSDLHNFLKRELTDRLQVQCAAADRLRSFYIDQVSDGRSRFGVVPRLEGKFQSYLRNLALGLLIVNRQWPWVLAQPTRYDAYVGLDVLKPMTAMSFFYGGGRRCVLRAAEAKGAEKLTSRQVNGMLIDGLRADLEQLEAPPRSIVLRRDGRAFHSERHGFSNAIHRLKQEGLLAEDVVVGVVEISKRTAIGLRLLGQSPRDGRIQAPGIGSWCALNDCEGIVATTGYPFRFPGTPQPLHVRIVEGNLNIESVLYDTFAMAQLAWAAPEASMRLPIDLKLIDDYLRSLAGAADDEAAVYEELDAAIGDST